MSRKFPDMPGLTILEIALPPMACMESWQWFSLQNEIAVSTR